MRTELARMLRHEQFSEDTWSLDGRMPDFADEALVLWEEKGLWAIAYVERGQPRREFSGTSEAEACQKFYELMHQYWR